MTFLYQRLRRMLLLAGSLLALGLALGSCQRESLHQPAPGVQGSAVFRLTASSAEIEVQSAAAMLRPRLRHVWYAILDAQRRVITPRYQKLSADLSQLTIEGMEQGDYSILFLATTEAQVPPEVAQKVTDPEQQWIENPSAVAPLGKEFFFREEPFTVTPEQRPIDLSVALQRCVGRLEVDFRTPNQHVRRFIRQVSISLDADSHLYTGMTAEGRPTGAGTIRDWPLSGDYSLLTLPSVGRVSGTVTVVSARSDSTTFTREYRFRESRVEAGRVSRIEIDYFHPEVAEGFFHVRQQDYLANPAADTMFLDREPREVFYARRFWAHEPLQVAVDANRQLKINHYSPIPIRDVRIKCRLKRYSLEFFDLAHFDMIYPFQEFTTELPMVRGETVFHLADGRRVRIPAQTTLSNDDVEFRVTSSDPFMQKIATINSRWDIRFGPYGADDGHAYWRHMTPEMCRHGVGLVLNMAYIFSSPEFNAELQRYDGILTDDAKVPIDLASLRERIRTHSGLTLGLVSGVGGLGGGRTYGLANYCYRGYYFDATPPGSNPHNYDRMAMFHEYGHCLGYGHDSNMTYGDQWTVLCARVLVSMGEAGLLPVNSRWDVLNLPR